MIFNIKREACSMFACNDISFNHESPVRGETSITRKIIDSSITRKYMWKLKMILQNGFKIVYADYLKKINLL